MERMLLSYNFNLAQGELPILQREEFAQVFIDGFQAEDRINCKLIDNYHWIVEIQFSPAQLTPEEVAKLCGNILWQTRQKQKKDEYVMPDLLLLGGRKTTPSSSISVNSLHLGEWGVDVVETPSADVFLASIQWDQTIEAKPRDSFLKVEFLGQEIKH